MIPEIYEGFSYDLINNNDAMMLFRYKMGGRQQVSSIGGVLLPIHRYS